jgi:hypothetical protein
VCEKRGYTWKAYEINQDYCDMASLLVQNGFPKTPKKQKKTVDNKK